MYTAVTAKASTLSGIINSTQATPSQENHQSSTMTAQPFDYQSEIKQITHDIENKLKAKLEAAIANLQSLVNTLEKKFEQKLNTQIESLKTTQADRITQDNHSHELAELTKSVRFLVDQVTHIADTLNIPMPRSGIGRL